MSIISYACARWAPIASLGSLMHMAPEYILVNLSVDFDAHVGADEVETAVKELDNRIKNSLPRVKRVFIEAEARVDSSFAARG